jgi:regulator of RNase E activity RraA
MKGWHNDEELYFVYKQELYTPVVGDILDKMGYFHQFLPQSIHPVKENMIVIGRAMPVLMSSVDGYQKQPFGKLTQALDQLEPGEIYIGTGCPLNCAAWGELLTAAAKYRKANGAVLNGFHRDTARVLEQDWPVFSLGAYAQDSAPRMTIREYRCKIEISDVAINPGDLIFGDQEGVLVIPKGIEKDVTPQALEKSRGEKLVRRSIEKGMSSTDAFRKYGIL